MKKIIPLFFLAGLIISGCKKEDINASASKQSFLDSAISFLKSNLSQNDFDKLDISKNVTLIYNGRNIGLQVFEKNENNDKYLLLKADSNKYSGNWVDMSGLKSTTIKSKSGTILLTSIDKKISQKLLVQNNAAIQLLKTNNVDHTSESTDFTKKSFSVPNSANSDNDGQMLPEVIIYYDVDANRSMFYGCLYWFFSGADDSGLYFSTDGGGRGGDNVFAPPIFISPNDPIDIKRELECFKKSPLSIYKIAINVNQPNPNSRNVTNVSSDFMVGHTFLTFQQINPDGSTIVRNVGFYPKTMAKPGASVDISIFGDDSNTPFDVSMNFAVTGTEFMTVINTVFSQQSKLYDLNSFNCTDAPLNALRSININLPATKSTNTYFNGDDPADLGEDMRGLDLDNFSSTNGNRKITRTVSNFDDQKPLARQGGC